MSLIDLKLTGRSFNRQVSCRDYVDLVATGSGSLDTVTGRNGLVQAVINRLFTRRGELKQLGHAVYGSRLHLLIGEPDNARTRGLAELYIRECLNQEQGIGKIVSLSFAPPSRGADRNLLKATITVQPADGGAGLSFIIPISLED